MENSSELFYKKLESADKPGVVLADFYCDFLRRETTKSEIMMCNKLVRLFGRFTVFYALLDFMRSNKQIDEPYQYLFAICQSRLESAHPGSTAQSRTPLKNYIANLEEEIEQMKKRKLKIPPLEELEKDA